MKLYNWLIMLFSFVFLSTKFDSVEASYTSTIIFGLTYNRLYKAYRTFISQYISKELLKLLPGPIATSLLSRNDVKHDNLSLVAILEDNKDLVLGDVLIDGEGEIFFFMAPTKKDPIVSTLMRASTGLYEVNHEIQFYTLIKRYEDESSYYLNYADDADVRDHFKVFQEYGGYTLLGSSCYSIVFVAPSSDIDAYIRGEFEEKIQSLPTTRNRINSIENQGLLSVQEAAKNEGAVVLPLTKRKEYIDEFLVSPDSIAHLGLLEDLSSIERLFVRFESSSELKFKFIYDKLVPMLIYEQLTLSDAFVLVHKAADVFRRDRTVEFIQVESGETITVVGDIHGQFIDLLRIFKNCGWPSDRKKYLFNGDIVDRGPESIQCLMLLYALKIAFPKSVFINRGNHESEMCGVGTFFRDMYDFDPTGSLFKEAQRGFVALPLAHVINDRIYVVHGGVRADYSLDELAKVDRFRLNEFARDFMYASLWDDASEVEGITVNPRGPSCRNFGPDVTRAFLERNELNLLIRSHTYISSGANLSQGGYCLTLFSAPNYCGEGNVAAVVTYDSDLDPLFAYFEAKKTNSPIEY